MVPMGEETSLDHVNNLTNNMVDLDNMADLNNYVDFNNINLVDFNNMADFNNVVDLKVASHLNKNVITGQCCACKYVEENEVKTNIIKTNYV